MDPKPIRRLLVANRGEIAVRVARAAREAGIVPLGVFSDADANAYHLEFMDDAARLGPAPARESYLDIARVLDAARVLGADALHPGYGFLSERAPFAQAVIDAGLIFVGPPPSAIAAMGDKAEAKRRAREHGVPVVPGYDGDDQSVETLRREAKAAGLPLLIKARAGGGGRGMRVITDLAGFDEALEGAQREALAAFGDASVLLEKYLERPRHVEFQIFADAHGTTLHFGERECSIQRRHQKVIEEAPSVALTPELREAMGAAAIRAAESVGYVNAGTVEFLLDQNGAFYFLETNARLQVEHPVTELVYGVDLVRMQLAIAGGERLTLKQSDIVPRGWAIEARINAEDPAHEYLPSTGTIGRWEPPTGPGLRLDAGVRSGSEVSIYYDSLLGKLIAHGTDRASAAERLAEALEIFRIEGVRTNLPLLHAIAREPDFRAGKTTTAYLAEHPQLLASGETVEPDAAFLLAIAAVLLDGRVWRVAGTGIPLALRGARRSVHVIASRAGEGDWQLEGDLAGAFRIGRSGESVRVEGAGVRAAGRARLDAAGVTVVHDGATFALAFEPPPTLGERPATSGGARGGAVTSPMPGKIVKVAVKAGETVAERDLLVVLEAMKMEHRIEATHGGVVKNVAVAAGDLVKSGATLLEIG
jgi:3-methylcrotonyl-CoA carboxylase alpha subunit